MTFPAVISRSVSYDSATTSTSNLIGIPSHVTDDLLLIIHASFHSGGGTPEPINTPAGWTLIRDGEDLTGRARGIIFAKKAIVSEGGSTTVTVTRTNGRAFVAHVLRINDWDYTGNLFDVVKALDFKYSLNNSSPDPPNLVTGWGAVDTLWIAGFTMGDDNAFVVTSPLNYTSVQENAAGAPGNSSCEIATAYRSLNASSEDPSTWVLNQTEEGQAWTIAVKPGTAVNTLSLSYPAYTSGNYSPESLLYGIPNIQTGDTWEIVGSTQTSGIFSIGSYSYGNYRIAPVAGASGTQSFDYILLDNDDSVPFAITNAVNNGAGRVRLTAPGHNLETGDGIYVENMTGVTSPNNLGWKVTRIDGNIVDILASAAGSYTGGGEAVPVSYTTHFHTIGSLSYRDEYGFDSLATLLGLVSIGTYSFSHNVSLVNVNVNMVSIGSIDFSHVASISDSDSGLIPVTIVFKNTPWADPT